MKYHTSFVLILLFVYIDCKNVSDKNVTKRESYHGQDLFPDWVPFKNKHGNQLGEFVPVIKKVKKRLALPINYMMRAFADAEGDDYFSHSDGDGQSAGDIYDDKWYESNRNINASDIETVLGILTKHNPKHFRTQDESKKQKKIKKKKETKRSEDYQDEYEEHTTKSAPSSEEVKKAKILESVDKLKELHATEQRIISENQKDEAMHKEEREREIERAGQIMDKYGKYKDRKFDYDEYEDKELGGDSYDKYKIDRKIKPTVSTAKPTTTESYTTKKVIDTPATGRFSVFRNPSIYMVYDDDNENEKSTTESPISSSHVNVTKNPKFSSKITEKLVAESERISLVPQDNESRGEPTLFFPQKRRPKYKNKLTTSILMNSKSTMSDLVNEPGEDTSGSGTSFVPTETAPSGDGSLENQSDKTKSTGAEFENTVLLSAPSGTASEYDESSTPDAVASALDAVSASSDQDAEKKSADYEKERGGMKEHHSEHHSDYGESGKKEYSAKHKESKTKKGYHDKEDHLGKYHDHGGHDEEHHDEKKHYGAHHHEEQGKKHAEYEESGKHSKGHNTKGSHDIHKKEEYEKKVEFFEEEGDSFEEEIHAGHKEETGHKQRGNFKKSDEDGGFKDSYKGTEGHQRKTNHIQVHKGHGSSDGHDQHRKRTGGKLANNYGRSGKKWIYHHGNPAHNANLVVIDRRRDLSQHGSGYYG